LQEQVPDDRLGRVSSINQLSAFGFWPLGFALTGIIADRISPVSVFLGAGIVVVISYSLALCLRSIRRVQ
jgi:hypothetical protein